MCVAAVPPDCVRGGMVVVEVVVVVRTCVCERGKGVLLTLMRCQ